MNMYITPINLFPLKVFSIHKKRFVPIYHLVLLLFIASCQKQTYVYTDTKNSTTSITNLGEDSNFVGIINPYKIKLDSQMTKIIGESALEMQHANHQSLLGNFISDLILEKTSEYAQKEVDFSLVTKGGLRIPLPKGKISMGTIFELMPFENELVIVHLKGNTVKKIFNYAAVLGNAYMSNVKYRVTNGIADSMYINNALLDTNKIYTMATSDYLANGGDKLSFISEKIEMEQIGKLLRETIIEYIEEKSKKKELISSQLDDRVKID